MNVLDYTISRNVSILFKIAELKKSISAMLEKYDEVVLNPKKLNRKDEA